MPEYEALNHSAQPRDTDRRVRPVQYTITALQASELCDLALDRRNLSFTISAIRFHYTITCYDQLTSNFVAEHIGALPQ